MTLTISALVAAAFAALLLYIRLAPSDPIHWHEPLPTTRTATCSVTPSEGSASYACILPDPPETLLRRLDTIATATPRTTRLAGDPASGRVTYVTRSALWGFPHFTTAQTTPTPDGTRLDLHARLRFGRSDMGVNAARLALWTKALTAR